MHKKVFLLIFIGFFLYVPTVFGQFVWDDEDFVFANQYVATHEFGKFFTENAIAGRGKVSNYFRLIQESTYSVIHLGFGYNSFVYHLANVIVHIASTVSIFWFFFLFTKDKRTAFFVALLFLIHPIQTEAVSYVSGLSDPLFVLFGFVSLGFFLRKQHILSLVFFTLSFLSKENGVVFLGVIGLIEIIQEKAKNIFRLMPYIFLTAIYLGYHFLFINPQNVKLVWGNTPYANSVTIRLATFIRNLFDYLGLVVFPKDLFMERDFSVKIATSFVNPYTMIFFLANLLLLVFLFKFRTRISHFSLILFSYLGFYLSFLPVSGIVLINGIFYEHFLYLPLVFFASFWFLLLGKKLKGWVFVLFIVYLVGLSLRNVARQLDWIDPIRFYRQTLSHAPQSIRIRNGLGMAYAESGDIGHAIETYQEAIQLDPSVPNLYHNVANIYRAKGDLAQAEEYYKKAIATDPNFVFSYQSLLVLYKQTGQRDKETELLKLYLTRFGQALPQE